MAFALPFTFEHDDYVQILTDIADKAGSGARLAAAVLVTGGARVPRLLVVHHTSSPALRAMLESVVAGARDPELAEAGIDVVVSPALAATVPDVLAADGVRARHAGEHRLHVRRAQAFLRPGLLPVPRRQGRGALRALRARGQRHHGRGARGDIHRVRARLGGSGQPGRGDRAGGQGRGTTVLRAGRDGGREPRGLTLGVSPGATSAARSAPRPGRDPGRAAARWRRSGPARR